MDAIKFMKTTRAILTLALLSPAIVACSRPSEGDSGGDILANQSSSPTEVGDPVWRSEVPAGEPGMSREQPESWQQFMSLQTPQDQEYLEQLDHRYFGALSFRTDEEREYLSRNGFPTPEDWLAARSKTDDQLRQEADSGSLAATALYADRMTVRFRDLLELAEKQPDAVTDRERVHAATMAVWYATRAESNFASPLGPYLSGMAKSSIYKTWEPMTAAMLEAMHRGDPRVDRLLSQMHTRHPKQDVQLLHTVLRGMAPEGR